MIRLIAPGSPPASPKVRPEALFEVNDRLIVQLPADLVEAGLGVTDVPGAGRPELGLDIRSKNLVDRCDQVERLIRRPVPTL